MLFAYATVDPVQVFHVPSNGFSPFSLALFPGNRKTLNRGVSLLFSLSHIVGLCPERQLATAQYLGIVEQLPYCIQPQVMNSLCCGTIVQKGEITKKNITMIHTKPTWY